MGSDFKGFDLTATGGVMIEDHDAFQRLANTTAYAADDVLARTASDTDTDPLHGLTVARQDGGGGYIVGWSLSISGTGMTPRVRVHLFSVPSPATAIAGDNLAFAEYDANEYEFVKSFDLPNLVLNSGTGADMTRSVRDDLRIPFRCADNSRKLYYRYQILDGDTPAASTWVRTSVLVDGN